MKEPLEGDYKYFTVRAQEQKEGAKTFVYCVQSDNHLLGHIKWFGRWRQYSFFPATDTIFNSDCLNDIQTFLRRLKEARKQK